MRMVIVSQERTRFGKRDTLLNLLLSQAGQLRTKRADRGALGANQNAALVVPLPGSNFEQAETYFDDLALLAIGRRAFPAGRFDIDDEDLIKYASGQWTLLLYRSLIRRTCSYPILHQGRDPAEPVNGPARPTDLLVADHLLIDQAWPARKEA